MKKTAMYLRLSIEDDGEKEESNSIINQRKQILAYIHHDSTLLGFEVEEFCDDGCSGTNMNRPGVQKLLKEIKANCISCVIVKDLSRFSRDYIELGTYLNQIFPFMGIRFISINDHYDSREYQGNTIGIDTAFQTLLYDLYSKDISIKVKAAFEAKCASGEYVFGNVPFGYEKSKKEKNKVVVCEQEAEVVRRIFKLAMKGMSSARIAKELYEAKVPTRMQMRRPDRTTEDGIVHSWSEAAVRSILNNRFYLGEMAYGKTIRKSVGSKTGKAVPKEEWKVVEGCHEPLISKEVFEQVSSFRPGYSTKRNREQHPLTGKLFCGGCRYSMNYKPQTGKNKYRRFECRKHALLQIPECCTYIRADLLEETVLLMLNKQLMLRGNAMKQRASLVSFQQTCIQMWERKLEDSRGGIKQIQVQKDTLYERYAFGELEEMDYREKAQKLTEQLSLLSVKGKRAETELVKLEDEYQKTKEDMKEILRYSHLENLTNEVVEYFIKRIYVYKDKRIEIEWNFSAG